MGTLRPSRNVEGLNPCDLSLDAAISKARDKLVAWLAKQYEHADAEDFAHTAILRVLKQPERYVPKKGKFDTWLFGVAKNIAIDEVRRRERLELVDIDLVAEGMLPSVEGPDQCYHRQVRNTRLYRALLRLRREQRFPVILHCMLGRSYTVIGARLKVKPEQARYQVKKGLAALRTILRE